jgi:hypothetical protein
VSAPAFYIGSTVRIIGERGARYTVKRTDDDGTVVLWGGRYQHEKYRQVPSDRLVRAEPRTRR